MITTLLLPFPFQPFVWRWVFRLWVVPYFSSGIEEHAWKSPHVRKGDTRLGERKLRDYRLIFLSPRRVSSFLTSGDFHARSRFALSTIPEEKWWITHSLGGFWSFSSSFSFWWPSHCYVAVAVLVLSLYNGMSKIQKSGGYKYLFKTVEWAGNFVL